MLWESPAYSICRLTLLGKLQAKHVLGDRCSDFDTLEQTLYVLGFAKLYAIQELIVCMWELWHILAPSPTPRGGIEIRKVNLVMVRMSRGVSSVM